MSLRTIILGSRDEAVKYLADARRMMDSLKHSMSFNELDQGYDSKNLETGVSMIVSSVFGQDILIVEAPFVAAVEKEVGIDIYYVFLVRDQSTYAVWKITGGGATLIAVDMSLENYVQAFVILSGSDNFGTSTVKSNSRSSLHKYHIEDILGTSLTPTTIYGESRYGTKSGKAAFDFIIWGLRNSYNGDGVFNTNIDYLSHNADWYSISYPFYLGSARNNWYMEDDAEYTDMELWATDANNGEIRVNGGDVTRNVTLDGLTEKDSYFGLINKSKYIGVSEATSPAFNDDITIPVTVGMCPSGTIVEDWVERTISYSEARKYMFGDVVLESGIDAYVEDYDAGSFWSPSKRRCDAVDCPVSSYQQRTGRSIWIWASGKRVNPYDYDHLNNDDETFIILYHREGTLTYNRNDYEVLWWTTGTTIAHYVGSYGRSGNTREFVLGYRLGGEDLVRVPIAQLSILTYHETDTVEIVEASGISCPNYHTTQFGNTAHALGCEGQKLFDMSCRATDKYLTYSYILSDFTGDTGNTDLDINESASFTFNKRVIGVINVDTGVRTEFDVDADLKGDIYSSFDESIAYAIGQHIEEVT